MKSYKITLLGNTGVGKSSLTRAILNKDFSTIMESTIGAAFVRKIDDDYVFEIWDTAGQERYRSICPLYYRNSHIIICVFDVNTLSTIDDMAKYIKDVSSERGSDGFQYIIVGAQYDRFNTNNSREMRNYFIDVLGDKFSPEEIIFTSSKTRKNINTLIKRMKELCDNIEETLDEEENIIDLSMNNKRWWNKICWN